MRIIDALGIVFNTAGGPEDLVKDTISLYYRAELACQKACSWMKLSARWCLHIDEKKKQHPKIGSLKCSARRSIFYSLCDSKVDSKVLSLDSFKWLRLHQKDWVRKTPCVCRVNELVRNPCRVQYCTNLKVSTEEAYIDVVQKATCLNVKGIVNAGKYKFAKLPAVLDLL